MSQLRGLATAGLALTAMLGGCAVAPPLTAVPGQGKTYADFVRDDGLCRGAAGATATSGTTAATTAAPAAATPAGYYQCMAARGELVVPNRPVGYPAYAAYPYAYPYGPYPYGLYGYPYGPYYGGLYPGVGFGIGIGYFGGGWHDGWRGGFHDGWHGGFHDGFRSGEFHGGGFHGGGHR